MEHKKIQILNKFIEETLLNNAAQQAKSETKDESQNAVERENYRKRIPILKPQSKAIKKTSHSNLSE